MGSIKTLYVCQSCGHEITRWVGQCPSCGAWNTLVETVTAKKNTKTQSRSTAKIQMPISLSKIISDVPKRISSNITEFDRVIGGGFVPGQVVLLSGDPGVGKSTLLTQLANKLSDEKVLYVCGEENLGQVKIRAARMNYKAENLYAISETDVDSVVDVIKQTPELSLIIVDSIQSMLCTDLTGVAGSVGQVKECAQRLTLVAKEVSIPIIIVGHVTKEGTVAGPKVLEHIVDTVLYLEGDSQHLFRILRTTKNRFGPVSEIGVFEMDESGMLEVSNPSQLFLSERSAEKVGSCITVIMEGYRPLLFEVQALAIKTNFGYPKRTTSGFNANRLQVLIAVLEKCCGVHLSSYDVYLNVAGGFKINENAADLAVCLAVVSSIKNIPLVDVVAFGECGLLGEIRKVPQLQQRINEAKKMGFTHILAPENIRSISQAIREASKSI